MHMYIDDWLIRAQSSKIVQSQSGWVLHLCSRLGLRVKSDLVPYQDFTFIGDSAPPCVPPVEKSRHHGSVAGQLSHQLFPHSVPVGTAAGIAGRNGKASSTGSMPHERLTEMPGDPVGLYQSVPTSCGQGGPYG